MKHLVAKNTFISQNLTLNFLSFALRICMLNAGLGTFATKMTRTLVKGKTTQDTSWLARCLGQDCGGFQRSDFILKFIAKTQPWTENHTTTMKVYQGI